MTKLCMAAWHKNLWYTFWSQKWRLVIYSCSLDSPNCRDGFGFLNGASYKKLWLPEGLHLKMVTTAHSATQSKLDKHQCVVLHAYNKCMKSKNNAIHRTHVAKENRPTPFSQRSSSHSCIKIEILQKITSVDIYSRQLDLLMGITNDH